MGLFSGIGKALGKVAKVAIPAVAGWATGGWGGALTALGGVLGAQDQQNFSAAQTDKQMQFQERMSSTAHQREVADLTAAGLNPILSATKGGQGASTPSGAAAQGVNVAKSGAESAVLAGQTKLLEAQALQSATQAELNSASTAETVARTQNLPLQGEYTQAQTRQIGYQIANVLANTHLTGANEQKVYAEMQQLIKQGNLTDASVKEVLSRAGLNSALIPEVAARIRKIGADIANTNANTGFQELKGLPGNIIKYLANPDASSAKGTIPNDVIDGFSNSAKRFKQHMRDERTKLENSRR